jgi:hypothetical protein
VGTDAQRRIKRCAVDAGLSARDNGERSAYIVDVARRYRGDWTFWRHAWYVARDDWAHRVMVSFYGNQIAVRVLGEAESGVAGDAVVARRHDHLSARPEAGADRP